jgi:hypothetical protein
MQMEPFGQFIKFPWNFGFNMKSVFLTVLQCWFEFYKNLQIGLNQFGPNLKKLWKNQKSEKQKYRKEGKKHEKAGGGQSSPAPDQARGPGTNPKPVPSPFLSLTLTGGPHDATSPSSSTLHGNHTQDHHGSWFLSAINSNDSDHKNLPRFPLYNPLDPLSISPLPSPWNVPLGQRISLPELHTSAAMSGRFRRL